MKQKVVITSYAKHIEVKKVFKDMLVQYLLDNKLLDITSKGMLEAGIILIMSYLSKSDEGREAHKKQCNMPNNPVDEVLLQLENDYEIEYRISKEDWNKITADHNKFMAGIREEIYTKDEMAVKKTKQQWIDVAKKEIITEFFSNKDLLEEKEAMKIINEIRERSPMHEIAFHQLLENNGAELKQYTIN